MTSVSADQQPNNLSPSLALSTSDLCGPPLQKRRLYESRNHPDGERRRTLLKFQPSLCQRKAWSASLGSKAGAFQHRQTNRIELHQSTCLILNESCTNSTESDLWILPDFEEWETEGDACDVLTASQKESSRSERTPLELTPLVQRAVRSNRERLKRKLEGDGWDFVGGKYGEDIPPVAPYGNQVLHEGERLDEEFDVVVLPLPLISVS
ncbi:hypothetical protein BU24DRAFT_352 [Aaosphaeria arxii CBS 175.79]|uniref:Uncharacterized protein n=1 Tax=Aaosphaeria arxii CBS 175.79 TaxID=1450172 RepID=A0A6A5Y465_9PLEO|nr:uncharacterized protein BU24DRAFT_352 [Aaosphaeria arxii CBS 175.79]KAF2020365.1 hypothetical protein BU24DRAFT_352 [Aaosphaeria arxii CBS 175.79]